MGLFDFLNDHQTIQPSQPTQGMLGDQSVGEMIHPPEAQTQPGLMTRLHTPDPQTGQTFGDKLMMAASLMRDNGDPSSVVKMQQARLEQAKFQRQQALQARGNQAFRAAYRNGRFDPSVYAQVMGDALDPGSMATLAKTVNPEQKLEGAFITEHNPITGKTEIVGQRPMDYGETTNQQQADEARRHNQVGEGYEGQRIAETGRHDRVEEGQGAAGLGLRGQEVGIAGQHLGLARQQFAAQQHPGAVVIGNPADYGRLTPGTSYIAPDGSVRVKGRQ